MGNCDSIIPKNFLDITRSCMSNKPTTILIQVVSSPRLMLLEEATSLELLKLERDLVRILIWIDDPFTLELDGLRAPSQSVSLHVISTAVIDQPKIGRLSPQCSKDKMTVKLWLLKTQRDLIFLKRLVLLCGLKTIRWDGTTLFHT